jgi:hypothetical protein
VFGAAAASGIWVAGFVAVLVGRVGAIFLVLVRRRIPRGVVPLGGTGPRRQRGPVVFVAGAE